MATGSYDANGIWNYGEDDNIALFSDTLNKLADSTSDAFTSDRNRISTLEAGSLSGLIPLLPTTITVAGGTVSFNNIGLITFTSATSLSINGVFTSNYKNYKLVFNLGSTSAANDLTLRLRNIGTDLTTAVYNRHATITNANATTGTFTSSGDTKMVLGGISNATNTGAGSFDITDPFTSIRKTVNGIFTGYNQSQAASSTTYGGAYINSTSTFDGLTIYPSTGNITGTLQVFGYND